jgi:predicted MPP superfamily phosphohydrolase
LPIFVAALAVLLGLLSWFLHRRLARAPAWPYAARRGAAITLALGWALVLAAFAASDGIIDPDAIRPVTWTGMTWLSVFFYLVLGSLAVAAISLTIRTIHRGRSDDARRRFHRAAAPVVIATALGATGYGLHEASMPRMTPVLVSNDRLPDGFVGLKVALITDLHVGPVRDGAFTRRVVEAVNAQKPDLVVLGGDLADGTVEHSGEHLDPIRDLEAPLGVIAVSGNHEFISQEPNEWMAYWESLGVTVLRNSSVELTRGSDTVTVAGVNDPMAEGVDAPDVAKALAGDDPNGYTILLAHQPRQALSAEGRGVDLQLSGHTHGGQLWPFTYAVLAQQPVVDGLGPVGDVPVLTSRGAGAWGPPVRVFAPPEVPIITLVRH